MQFFLTVLAIVQTTVTERICCGYSNIGVSLLNSLNLSFVALINIRWYIEFAPKKLYLERTHSFNTNTLIRKCIYFSKQVVLDFFILVKYVCKQV